MNDSKTVVVLGGGVGGIVSAMALRKRLPRQHRVIMVDRESRHLFSPSLLWLMTGSRSESNITRPVEKLSRKGIEVIHDEIVEILPETRQVRLGSGQTLDADHLVVSLGCRAGPGRSSGTRRGWTLFLHPVGSHEPVRRTYRLRGWKDHRSDRGAGLQVPCRTL